MNNKNIVKNAYMKSLIISAALMVMPVLFNACATIPKGAKAIKPFDKTRYLGQWYEIARFDFRFEKNLNKTTANYSVNNDGSIKVVNRGYNYLENKWKEATGRAKFAGDPDEARLKVSFFGPFYAPYNVIALDDQYRYALVAGKNLSYLWILSRETTIPDEIKEKYLKVAQDLGFDTSRLVWVEQ